MTEFNTDNPVHIQQLMDMHPADRRFEYKKLSKYDSGRARWKNLTPVEQAMPDKLIPFDGLEAAIANAHAQQSFPMYHQRRLWFPEGFSWNQNGLGYCWTWGGCAALMTCRNMEDKPHVMLAPASMGYLVNWKNEGNYLESWIQGAIEKGVCPALENNWNSTKRSASYWAQWEEHRKLYRLDPGAVFDTDPRDDKVMLQHIATLLCAGIPLYIAYHWWGHALQMCGLIWAPGEYLNVKVVDTNSHDDLDWLILAGTKMIPDEAYGFGGTMPTNLTLAA